MKDLDFSAYFLQSGQTASSDEAAGHAGGLELLATIRMLRQVYGLSQNDAKRLAYRLDRGRSLEDLDPELVRRLVAALDASDKPVGDERSKPG